MRRLDEQIPEHLQDLGDPTPMLMAGHSRFSEMEVSSGQIRERCAKLAEAGLITASGKGWFDITTWGQQSLEVELNVENQPRSNRMLYSPKVAIFLF